MKIDKAIEILVIHNDHNPDFTDAERQEAHQLGIEALKAVKDSRSLWGNRGISELPDETKE